MLDFGLLGIGVGLVAYGVKGERIPDKIIKIVDNDSDNSLRLAERLLWIAIGIAAIVSGLNGLYQRYKVA